MSNSYTVIIDGDFSSLVQSSVLSLEVATLSGKEYLKNQGIPAHRQSIDGQHLALHVDGQSRVDNVVNKLQQEGFTVLFNGSASEFLTYMNVNETRWFYPEEV